MELVKQVDELAKQVMVAEHYYFAGWGKTSGYETEKESIGDELADGFSMVIRIADHYDIDLVEAHIKARKRERDSLTHFGV